jgi:hypothetical protein
MEKVERLQMLNDWAGSGKVPVVKVSSNKKERWTKDEEEKWTAR